MKVKQYKSDYLIKMLIVFFYVILENDLKMFSLIFQSIGFC